MEIIALCILIALAFYFFEIFVPGGVLFTIGSVALLAASYFAYAEFGLLAGVLTLCGSLAVALLFLVVELKWIGRNRFARRFLLREERVDSTALYEQSRESRVGQEGVTVTRLNPTGVVRIDGRQYEASSRRGMLAPETEVRVVAQDNFRVIVEPR